MNSRLSADQQRNVLSQGSERARAGVSVQHAQCKRASCIARPMCAQESWQHTLVSGCGGEDLDGLRERLPAGGPHHPLNSKEGTHSQGCGASSSHCCKPRWHCPGSGGGSSQALNRVASWHGLGTSSGWLQRQLLGKRSACAMLAQQPQAVRTACGFSPVA